MNERMNEWNECVRVSVLTVEYDGACSRNVSVRMVCIFFGALSSRTRKNLMTARVSMLLKSRTLPDMLPFSLCNKKRLAIRHMNRPLFPTTLPIPSYDFGKFVGLRPYQHPFISYYRRYVDDIIIIPIIIIFDQNKINEELITNYMKNTHTQNI